MRNKLRQAEGALRKKEDALKIKEKDLEDKVRELAATRALACQLEAKLNEAVKVNRSLQQQLAAAQSYQKQPEPMFMPPLLHLLLPLKLHLMTQIFSYSVLGPQSLRITDLVQSKIK